jgi:hypothetical protein
MIELMGKIYHAKKYNCAHFACDVVQHITGKNINRDLAGLLMPVQNALAINRKTIKRIAKPFDGCLVLATSKINTPHVGVFYRNHVIHLKETGAIAEGVATFSLHHERVAYYAV